MKRRMFKILLFLLTAVLLTAVAACSDGDETTPLQTSAPDPETTAVTTAVTTAGSTQTTTAVTTANKPKDTTADTTAQGGGDVIKPTTNLYTFEDGEYAVLLELCSDRTVRVQASDKTGGYRPDDPEYYMVQKDTFALVSHTVEKKDGVTVIRTAAVELRIEENPFRIAAYDLDGNLLTKDTEGGIYRRGSQVGVKKEEGNKNAGGIFGFGSGDHGRRAELNRYGEDFSEFTMSHGRLVAPFFMSSVGYGVFLNTISESTTFFKEGGGFETSDYLDYFLMYGPDFKAILNEYAEITGRMELYGKWVLGFMLSKYGNDNATQAEFLEWIHRLRDEGYPSDVYVFDYGWRGDVNVTQSNHSAGEKWGNQMWSNDLSKFPNIDAMFAEARELGFHVGLHNNAGTPEASGGTQLHLAPFSDKWVESYMESVIKTGYGDFFWPDEFDVLGSNTAPVFAALGAYEAWKAYTVETRPMFMTRGSYAGHHFATAWSGDIDANTSDLRYQIGFSLDAGLVGYWAVSHDLGGFKTRPSDDLYTRWVAEFGAWCGIMRTHGHDGREPWDYDETAQKTLKENLRIRYSLYPYLYTTAWQGYSTGVPMMRAMILEDGSQFTPAAWNLNCQYYLGDFFLVAPATSVNDTYVSVWFPPNTTWYHYFTGERYEGGATGNTVRVFAALDEIPVFVKAGAIIPMGPDVNYADEKPLDPLTLDLYPRGESSYTLYEDDGVSRRYLTENAYSETAFAMTVEGSAIRFTLERTDHNPEVFTPCERDYILRFNHVTKVTSVTLDGKALAKADSVSALLAAASGYAFDGDVLLVKFHHEKSTHALLLSGAVITEPDEADASVDDTETLPKIKDGTLYELENAELYSMNSESLYVLKVDGEWKGYTGTGFVKPFKIAGDTLEFDANVTEAGSFSITLRVNCGKKNDSKYDSSNHTGTLYIDGVKAAELSIAVSDAWGDSSKNGIWQTYTYENILLSEGKHTFTIVAEGSNPGNFNLDSLTFTKETEASLDGFREAEAENADRLDGMTKTADGKALTVTKDGAYLGFTSLLAEGKKTFTIRVKSTGGTLTVYETGVGDKILCTVTLPEDGTWQTVTVNCLDTDAHPSAVYIAFDEKAGKPINTEIDWVKFGK